ncbi:MAG: amino acid permease, partial [Leptospiraceae bacterium]|nr:amino acid permease [Leptospiraceae bacterium]
LTAFALIWLLTVANCFGVFLSGILQDIFSAVKIGALLFIAVACFSANPELSNFGGTVLLSEEMKTKILGSASAYGDSFLGGLAALFASLRYSFFAYSGWEGATYVAEEVRNPEKNLPRSLFLGIGTVMVLYLLVNTSYLLQLTPQRMVDHKAVAVEAMLGALGVIGASLVAVAVMISTFGNVSTQVLVKSRTWHAMARDGLFFSFLKPLSSRYHSPNRSLLFQALWASCLLALAVSSELFRADPQSDTLYGTIIDFFSFTSAAFNVMTFGSVWILRKKLPDLPRPFRVPVLPLILGLVLLVQGAFMLFTLIQAPIPSLIGAALTCSGLGYWYWFVDEERRKPMSHNQILSELEKND